MSKTVGYIVAPVAVGLVLLFAATGCSKAESPAGTASPGKARTIVLPTKTYAEIKQMAVDMRDKVEESRAQAPDPNMVPPANYAFLSSFTLGDTGTVTGVANDMGRGTAYLDINGDGQPDLTLKFGAKPVPDDIKQGDKLDVEVKVGSVNLQGDQLSIIGTPKKYTPAGG